MEILLALGLVLVVVMVVGHLLWLAMAAIFRVLFSDDLAGSRIQLPNHPYQREPQPNQLATARPPQCPSPAEVTADELRATKRQLTRLCEQGLLEREHCDPIFQAIDAELAPKGSPAKVAAAAHPGVLIEPVLSTSSDTASQAAAPLAEVIDAVLVEPPLVSAQVAPKDVHPLDRPSVPAAPKPARHPGRSLADMLQSFMEESNIRWGEILAATLIVLCSVGLVVSLRNTLKNIPYFPAILFTLFTVAFHSAGLYTLRRWKLQAVSRVILIISLLLVPLAFCGSIVLQQTRDGTDPLFLAALTVGAGIFGWVAYSASRELAPRVAGPLAFGVLAPSMAQVLIQRLNVADGDLWRLQAACAIPIAGFLTATWSEYAARRYRRLTKPQILELLRVLGVALFALLVPLALILVRASSPARTIAHLSPQLSLAAAASLAIGLLIHLRARAPRLAAWQAVGTAIVVLAALLLLLLVAATWPDPELLLVVGLMNCASLAVLGFVAQIPVLYVPSMLCAALAATIGWHLVGGHFADRSNLALSVVQAAVRGQTSLVLIAIGSISAGFGALRSRQGSRDDAIMLFATSGGLAALSLLIALFSGFVVVPNWPQDCELAAFVLLTFAGGLFASGRLFKRREITACGAFVFWLALVQSLAMNPLIRGWLADDSLFRARPVLMATLVHGLITALAAIVAMSKNFSAGDVEFHSEQAKSHHQSFTEPLAVSAAVSLGLVAPWIVWVRDGQFFSAGGLALVAAVGWALLSAAQRWQWAISGLQAMTAAAVALFVAGKFGGTLEKTDWLSNYNHLLAQCAAAATATMIWATARRLTMQSDSLRRLLHAEWPAVDQTLLAVATLAVPVISCFAALPHVGWELGLSGSETVSPIISGEGLRLSIAWFAVVVICGALIFSLWERVTVLACAGLPIITFAGVWLVAEALAPASASASAARWAAAVYAILWAIAFLARDTITAASRRIPALRWDSFPAESTAWFGAQPLVCGGVTILIITILAVQQQIGGKSLNGPEAGTLFALLGPTISYLVPLLTLVVVLLAYAIREKQAGFALGGAAIWQLGANLAFLIATQNAALDDVRVIQWLQWNSLAAGSYAVIWSVLSRFITRQDADEVEQRLATVMWSIPTVLGGATSVALAAWAAIEISYSPGRPPLVLTALGSWPSYSSIGLALVAIGGRWRNTVGVQVMASAATALVAGLVPLVAASLNHFDPGGRWVAYHALETGWLLVGAVACAMLCWPSRVNSIVIQDFAPHHLLVAAITGLAALLAILGNSRDPAQPWWSLSLVVTSSVIAAGLALRSRNQPYAFASTVLAATGTTLFWVSPSIRPALELVFPAHQVEVAGFECIVLTLIFASGFWLWREIESQQRLGQSLDERWPMPRLHAFVLVAGMPIYVLYRMVSAMASPWFSHFVAADVLASVTVVALGCLVIAGLWDRRARFAIPVGYAWLGIMWLLVIGLVSPWLRERLLPDWQYDALAHAASFVMAIALQVAVSGHVWSFGANLAAWGAKLGVADPVDGLARTARWLPATNLALVSIVCLADCLLVLTIGHFQLPFRVVAALGPAVAAWGIACLAQDARREQFQLISLLVAGLTAVLLAWAQIDPDHTADVWLTRVFRLLMTLAALTFVYGLALPRLLLTGGDWNAATRKAGYVAAVGALATFAVTLGLEFTLFVPGSGVAIDNLQVGAVAVVLLVFMAGLISLALLPGRDPLLLSESGRQVYVYTAEATLVLVFAHVYMCRPLWFDGLLRPYWPFVVMGLAFAGVGAAELFGRLRIRVLAEPLARTGALLPLLPALGIWIVGSSIDRSLVLVTVGLLYVALSYTQKSWLAGVAAAVAGNGALWALLSESRMGFLVNPQLWLIPPALSVLIAAQINRRRLAPDVLAAIRYAATLVIYVSSTSEIMTRGFAAGLWPPMILLGLAVAGALTGIALRVRAFLVLGASFTFVALMAMVRHAAQSIEHVWPWWVFGISMGVAILFLFGLFEKKRAEVVLLIARLRQWEY